MPACLQSTGYRVQSTERVVGKEGTHVGWRKEPTAHRPTIKHQKETRQRLRREGGGSGELQPQPQPRSQMQEQKLHCGRLPCVFNKLLWRTGEADMGWSKLPLTARDGRLTHSIYRIEQDRTHTHPVAASVPAVETRRDSTRLVAVLAVAIAGETEGGLREGGRGPRMGYHSMRTAQPMAAMARCQCHEDAGWGLPWPLP